MSSNIEKDAKRGGRGGRPGKVLLSFDVEEFDLPREHGAEISLKRGVEVSGVGLERILEVLERTGVKATFFCTGNFARLQPKTMQKIVRAGHEVACHGVDHFRPAKTDAEKSKELVEKAAEVKVRGYRQPRMMKIDYDELKRCGYTYDSSINPALIPGRYNHLNVPRRPFVENEVVEIPTSVATLVRVPLFWLALHLFPLRVYVGLARMALRHDEYFATYFHPWEFAELGEFDVVPRYIKYNSGAKLAKRLEKVINELKCTGAEFVGYEEYVDEWRRR